ncbi:MULTISPECIES: TetR/AcrR family transcriptional regulator [Burkholderia]|uniref:TetR family transcriptional regulator n=1 Tax=Burkholderia aenigmatica TaxID=2015348 RepID=A0A228IHT0_9BURK|nr:MULTISPECIES: TetR/AcrR family transcriptional regulator [Burkholderia]AYQ41590.1 TetR/AcrR family transcriptional regulator [Burkholderia lata]MBN3843377.1 TetR/AcrR family transcriptional regulator [Burkholderia sp. Ac-20349]MCA8298136.1 TetR family transcriptional regulator [Burkholderia sp. AU30198]OXI41752.1 TetR family transcriptional regulator [Burkholderia aenigmatica]CAB3971447.1 TetR family transcriptional regulator [Burkholderia aenigmatica]
MTQTAPRNTQRVRGKSNTKPEMDKRERVIVAAERLFAREGYHGVSMRDIAKEADVGLPLIVYHFETKLGLYKAIFEYRKGLVEERLAQLEQITDFDQPDVLLKIATAFVSPIVRSYATPEGREYAQLVVREASDPQEGTRGIIEEYYDPIGKAYISAIRRALPNASDEFLCRSYLFAVGALVMSVFDHRIGRLSGDSFSDTDVEVKTNMLAAFIADGMQSGGERFK